MPNTIKILSEKEIVERLKETPGWIYENDKISKEYTFDSFTSGTRFVAKLGPFCDKIDHHPDISIKYNKIRFELTRADIGGKVTNKDFLVAKKIEKLFNKLYS